MTDLTQQRLNDLKDYMSIEFKDVKKSVDNLHSRIDKKVELDREQFAAKWVEKVVTGAVGIVLLSVFSALILLVINN